MKDILILWEGRYGHSEKTAKLLGDMFAGSQCVPAAEAPKALDGVKRILLVFGFLAYDTAKDMKVWLAAHREELCDRSVIVVGVGLAKEALPAFVKLVEEPMGRKADASYFVMGGYRTAELTEEDRVLLEDFWGKKGVPLTDKLYYKEETVKQVGSGIAALFEGR